MPVAQVEFRIEYQCIEIDHEQQKGSDEIFLVQDAVCGGANQSVVGEQEQEEDAEEQLCHYAEKNGNADFHTLFFGKNTTFILSKTAVRHNDRIMIE